MDTGWQQALIKCWVAGRAVVDRRHMPGDATSPRHPAPPPPPPPHYHPYPHAGWPSRLQTSSRATAARPSYLQGVQSALQPVKLGLALLNTACTCSERWGGAQRTCLGEFRGRELQDWALAGGRPAWLEEYSTTSNSRSSSGSLPCIPGATLSHLPAQPIPALQQPQQPPAVLPAAALLQARP